MLVLTRKVDQCIVIDGDIKVWILGTDAEGRVKVGVEAPKRRHVVRGELLAILPQIGVAL